MEDNKLVIYHISDSHTYHEQLKEPDGIDLIIFSGDESNYRDPYLNEPETREFLHWLSNRKCPQKIFVAGNHSTSIEKGLVKRAEVRAHGLIYLEDQYVTINGYKIFGTPWTPNFGVGWSFNRDRAKMDKIWSNVDEDTDIIVTHGPPKGILDLATDNEGRIEYCGDLSLRRHSLYRIKPQLVCFGHIHDNGLSINHGTRTIDDIIFSNGSLLIDGHFDKGIIHNGNIIILNKPKASL